MLVACTVCAGSPTTTFTTTAINYNSAITSYTIGGFLNDPAGANFSNPAAAALALNNTHIELVGTIGLLAGNNSFVVAHDDGLTLFITGIGLVVNQPGSNFTDDTRRSTSSTRCCGQLCVRS